MSIKAEHLTYKYGDGTAFEQYALKDVNFEIPDGQFVGLRENLKLNSSLTEPRQPIDEKRDWTAADIKRRTAELADAIVELFDFPEVEAPGDSAVESHLSKVTDPKAS